MKNYSLLGWSDGGITSLIIAAKNSAAINKLVLWGSNAYVSDGDKKKIQAIKDLRNWSAKSREPLEKMYGVEGLRKLWSDFVDEYSKLDDICSKDLADITCPVYLLWGDKDPLVAGEHFDFFMKNIKNIKYHRFPDGKHNIHIKYADEFNEIVENFLLN